MALVAPSAVDTPPDSDNPSDNSITVEGDVVIGDYSGNNSSEFVPGSNSCSGSVLTYPIDHPFNSRSNSNNGSFMHSVQYGKSPEFIVRLSRETAGIVGHPAVLECQIDGNPLPDIMWTKDDDDITESDDTNYSFELDALAGLCRLTIEKCRENDQGLYRCILENCFGACSSTTSLILASEQHFLRENNSPFVKCQHQNVAQPPPLQQPTASVIPPLQQLHAPDNSPIIIRELTTISEHLSQEEATVPSITASLTSDSIEAPSAAIARKLSVTNEGSTPETTTASATPDATPLECSVSNNAAAELWMTEPNILNREEENFHDELLRTDSGGGTVRTVVNYDLPHWHQLCMTTVNNRSSEEERNDLSTPVTELKMDEEFMEEREVEPTPVIQSTMVSSLRRNSRRFIDIEEPVDTRAVGDEELPVQVDEYSPEMMIELDEGNLSEEENEPTLDNTQFESDTVRLLLQEREPIVEKLHIDDDDESVPALVADVVVYSGNRQLSTTPSAPREEISINNCEENNSPRLSPLARRNVLSINVRPPTPVIHRTMSSPSRVQASPTRRNSFVEYFLSSNSNSNTVRRTIILQTLIALQITFLAFLAVNWQEHLIESSYPTPVKAVSSNNTATNAKTALTKAALAKATAIAAHRQHVHNYFAILTTPLSFVFVLVISSLFTFIFTSIQL